MAGARAAGGARNGVHRTAAGVPGQRPSGRDARGCCAALPERARGTAGPPGGHRHDLRQRLSRRTRDAGGGREGGSDHRPAPGPLARPTGRLAATAPPSRHRRGNRGTRVADARPWPCVCGRDRPPRCRRSTDRTTLDRLRPLARGGRLCAERPSFFTVARQTALRRGAADLSPGRLRRERTVGRCLPRSSLRSRRRTAGRRRCGRCCGERCRLRGRGTPLRDHRGLDRGHSRSPAARRGRRTGPQGLRRLPARCDAQRPRPRDARGLPVHRAHQALHDDRHGDRPRQDLERERPAPRRARTRQTGSLGRPHHLPHALHAHHLREFRGAGARRDLRPGAPHADARLGRPPRRGVRGCRHVEACPLLPTLGRGYARRRGA